MQFRLLLRLAPVKLETACRFLPFKLGAQHWYAGMRENITQPYQYVVSTGEAKPSVKEKADSSAI